MNNSDFCWGTVEGLIFKIILPRLLYDSNLIKWPNINNSYISFIFFNDTIKNL